MHRYIASILQNGVLNSIEEFYLRRRLWSLKHTEPGVAQFSSISDTDSYLALANSAVQNTDVFEKFRSNIEYRKILEHVTKSNGSKYLDWLSKNSINVNQLLNQVASVDITGGPLRYKFGSGVMCSPTTLRYLKVYFEIKGLFQPKNLHKIVEIGGGFGGQAAVFGKLSEFERYTIYDLPEVIALQKVFLKSAEVGGNFEFQDGRTPIKIESDLVVSNYALSEMNRSLQLQYIENVLRTAKSGYLTWNLISEKKLDGLSVVEVCEMIEGTSVQAEDPLTDDGNVIIIWGTLDSI